MCSALAFFRYSHIRVIVAWLCVCVCGMCVTKVCVVCICVHVSLGTERTVLFLFAGKDYTVTIVAIVLGSAALISMFAAAVYITRRITARNANSFIKESELTDMAATIETASIPKFVALSEVTRQHKLGSGNFGEVYKGTSTVLWCFLFLECCMTASCSGIWQGTAVALKKLSVEDSDKHFFHEAGILQ